jgi:hypothetical protein
MGSHDIAVREYSLESAEQARLWWRSTVRPQGRDCAGLESLVTTTVGSWAAVHLAAALNAGRHDMSHGLATSSWLSRDIAPPPAVRDGRITKDFKDKEFPCVSDVLSGNNVFLENLSETRVNMLFLCDLRGLQGELRSKTR